MKKIVATLRREVAFDDEVSPRSLYGIWPEVSISEEDIAEARREMWGNFPREDI